MKMLDCFFAVENVGLFGDLERMFDAF